MGEVLQATFAEQQAEACTTNASFRRTRLESSLQAALRRNCSHCVREEQAEACTTNASFRRTRLESSLQAALRRNCSHCVREEQAEACTTNVSFRRTRLESSLQAALPRNCSHCVREEQAEACTHPPAFRRFGHQRTPAPGASPEAGDSTERTGPAACRVQRFRNGCSATCNNSQTGTANSAMAATLSQVQVR